MEWEEVVKSIQGNEQSFSDLQDAFPAYATWRHAGSCL